MSCRWLRRVFVACPGGLNPLVPVRSGDHRDLVWVHDTDPTFPKSLDATCGGSFTYRRCRWCHVLLGVPHTRRRRTRGPYTGGSCTHRNLVAHAQTFTQFQEASSMSSTLRTIPGQLPMIVCRIAFELKLIKQGSVTGWGTHSRFHTWVRPSACVTQLNSRVYR